MLSRHIVIACIISLLCTSHYTIKAMEIESLKEPSRCKVMMTILGSMTCGGAGYLAYAMMNDEPALGTLLAIISLVSGGFTVCLNCGDHICKHNNDGGSCKDTFTCLFRRNKYQKLLIRRSPDV